MYKTLLTLLFMVAASNSQAALIWGTDASSALTGSRTSADFPTSGGVTATNGWAEGVFSISWDISFDGNNNLWTYNYTVDTNTDNGEMAAISGMILEVTESSPFTIVSINGEFESPQNWSELLGETGTLSDVYGLKFDFGADDSGIVTYTLVTDRAPVWGVFYGEYGESEGLGTVAYSNALSFADYKTITTLTENDYIVRPDGLAVIPIPPAVWLLGSALIGLIGIRRKA